MFWFIHENKNEENDNTEDDSIIQRLVEMVEKLTKWVVEIEDHKKYEN